MNVKIVGKSPNKQRDRVMTIRRDSDGVWITITPNNAKNASSGYSIFLSCIEFDKIKYQIGV